MDSITSLIFSDPEKPLDMIDGLKIIGERAYFRQIFGIFFSLGRP